MRLRSPAYAAAHRRAAAQGLAPADGRVCIADGWSWRKSAIWQRSAWHAVIPNNADPLEFDWAWVAGCDVFVVAAKVDRAIEIMRALRFTRRLVGLAVNDGRILV